MQNGETDRENKSRCSNKEVAQYAGAAEKKGFALGQRFNKGDLHTAAKGR